MIQLRYRIPEVVVPGKRLGRHVNHDPRSLAYAHKASGAALTSHRWSDDSTPILDQGDLGSCTGNATVGALLCHPEIDDLPESLRGTLDESLAVHIYSEATSTDPFPGTYPPTDTGSDGLDAAKAAVTFGYLSGYTHATSLTAALDALTQGPVICGITWRTGMDSPDASGQVRNSGTVRGGHEICFDEIDAENQRVWFRNSWGQSYGLNGRAWFSFADFGSVMTDHGDCTILVPVTQPAPVPTPPSPGDDLKEVVEHVEHALRRLLRWLEAHV